MAVFRLLMRRFPDAVPAGQLAQALALKPSTLSVYLSALTGVDLISKTRLKTSLHYQVRLESAQKIVDYLFLDCCRGRPQLCPPLDRSIPSNGLEMQNRKQNAIFICTGNSARSILAETILRHEFGDRFCAYSAGTRPAGSLSPLTIELLRRKGHDTGTLRSKPLDEFQREDAPSMDFIFTVCDQAANEECPFWPGQPISGHWGIPDPAAAEGTIEQKQRAFANAYGQMQARIRVFAELSKGGVDRAALQKHIDEIGAMPTNLQE